MSSPVICQIPKNVIYFVLPIAIQFEKLNNDLKVPRFIEYIYTAAVIILVEYIYNIECLYGVKFTLASYFTGLMLDYNLMKIQQFMMIALN